MALSAKWQKFYKWYCMVYCALTVLLVLLILIGGTAWQVRNEFIHTMGLYLGFGLMIVAPVLHVNFFLWAISLIVWLCRRNSAKGWHILGYGILMGVAEFVVFVAYAIVTGA